MKKKHILALVMAVMLMVTAILPLTASAAEMDKPPSIIINAPAGLMYDEDHDVFKAYKIFDVTFTGDNYSYVLVEEFEGFNAFPGASSTFSLQDYLDSLDEGDDAEALTDLATAILNYINTVNAGTPGKIAIVGDVTIEPDKATIDLDVTGGGYGYYLVYHNIDTDVGSSPYQQLVAACILTTTNPIAEITAKADAPTLTKKIKLADGSLVDVRAVNIGDPVTFSIVVTLPSRIDGYDPYVLEVHDIIYGSGTIFLSFDPYGSDGFVGNIVVSLIDPTGVETAIVLDDGVEFTLAPKYDGYDIVFDYDEILTILAEELVQDVSIKADVYKSILIEYTTVVNQSFDMTTSMSGINQAWAEFSNNPYGSSTSTTPNSVVSLYSSFLNNIFKVDGSVLNEYDNYEIYLENAEFNLYRLTKRATAGTNDEWWDIGSPLVFIESSTDWVNNAIYDGNPDNENTYISLVSDSNGLIDAYGLAPGVYMLRETVAPDGYNKLTYDIFFKIDFVKDDVVGYTFIKSVLIDEDNEFLYDDTFDFSEFVVIFDNTLYDDSDPEQDNWIYNIEENVYIENFSGTIFPGTGGIGTTIFYAVSAAMTLGLILFFVFRKREQEEPEANA